MAATLLQTSALTRTEGTGTAQTFTFSSGVPAGSSVLLKFVHYPGGAPTGVTDNLGNTYTRVASADDATNQAELWHALNISSNGTTPLVITATFSAGGNYTTGIATAWSGITALDKSALVTVTYGNTHTVTAASANSQADILAVTVGVIRYGTDNAGLGISSSGWTLLFRENNANSYEGGQAAYKHISAIETTSVTHTTTETNGMNLGLGITADTLRQSKPEPTDRKRWLNWQGLQRDQGGTMLEKLPGENAYFDILCDELLADDEVITGTPAMSFEPASLTGEDALTFSSQTVNTASVTYPDGLTVAAGKVIQAKIAGGTATNDKQSRTYSVLATFTTSKGQTLVAKAPLKLLPNTP